MISIESLISGMTFDFIKFALLAMVFTLLECQMNIKDYLRCLLVRLRSF